MLTQQRLKELLHYNPRTGIFTRKIKQQGTHIGAVAGCITKAGYVMLHVAGRQYSAHRLAWFYIYGKWPKNQIDHINHNKADNRIKNLRDTTTAENCQNKSRPASNNKTGFPGVCFHKRSGTYRAILHIGSYPTAKLAYAAWIDVKKKIHPTFVPDLL